MLISCFGDKTIVIEQDFNTDDFENKNQYYLMQGIKKRNNNNKKHQSIIKTEL